MAASIRRVKELGATPVLAYYSPIPGTALWPKALAASRYDLEHEPLYHNNSLFPCWPTFSWERYTRLKRLAQGYSCGMVVGGRARDLRSLPSPGPPPNPLRAAPYSQTRPDCKRFNYPLKGLGVGVWGRG